MPIIPGSQLTEDQRRQVTEAFPFRLTLEHAEAESWCGHCHNFWSVCLGRCGGEYVATDREWIEARAFHFTRAGKLYREKPCYQREGER